MGPCLFGSVSAAPKLLSWSPRAAAGLPTKPTKDNTVLAQDGTWGDEHILLLVVALKLLQQQQFVLRKSALFRRSHPPSPGQRLV